MSRQSTREFRVEYTERKVVIRSAKSVNDIQTQVRREFDYHNKSPEKRFTLLSIEDITDGDATT